jgi:actin-related protein 9
MQLHSGHSQSPSSIKLVKMPDYFPEWKEAGFEEAGFLGAQIAAKVIFVVDQGQTKGYMTRADYNEMGPSGIHDISL